MNSTGLLPYPGPRTALLVLTAEAVLGAVVVLGLARAKPRSRASG